MPALKVGLAMADGQLLRKVGWRESSLRERGHGKHQAFGKRGALVWRLGKANSVGEEFPHVR